MSNYIPLADCRDRLVYRLSSRNLGLGVFVAQTQGFIGIREKFGSEFLFPEYHWDTGPPLGTARPLEVLGRVPKRIRLKERFLHDDPNPRKCYWVENRELFRFLKKMGKQRP